MVIDNVDPDPSTSTQPSLMRIQKTDARENAEYEVRIQTEQNTALDRDVVVDDTSEHTTMLTHSACHHQPLSKNALREHSQP